MPGRPRRRTHTGSGPQIEPDNPTVRGCRYLLVLPFSSRSLVRFHRLRHARSPTTSLYKFSPHLLFAIIVVICEGKSLYPTGTICKALIISCTAGETSAASSRQP